MAMSQLYRTNSDRIYVITTLTVYTSLFLVITALYIGKFCCYVLRNNKFVEYSGGGGGGNVDGEMKWD